jgi:hypothetical protein
MKTRGFLATLFALIMLLCALQLTISTAAAASGSGTYSAQLISPTAGQVLYPGQQVMVKWNATLPNTNAGGCEMEVFLSLDGGRSFTLCLTPHIDPHATYFYWTVPNMPTNAAVLDIRFGCEWYYPESYSPQPASTFAIAPSTGQLY